MNGYELVLNGLFQGSIQTDNQLHAELLNMTNKG